MAFNQVLVRLFVAVGPGVFHAVLFFKAFNLAVTKHGKAGHCCHQSADTKILVALTKLSYGSFFVRVVHKVYITLENLRVKGNCVFYSLSVFVVFFLFEHVHKGRVINAVHA